VSTPIQLTVNGVKHQIEAEPETSLLEVLRNDLGLTGSKFGCGEGQCAACTVLIGGDAVKSCVTSISEVGAEPVTTIEGLEKNGKLHPLQQAFIDEDALQCGYCTAGMIMGAHSLLAKNPKPTDSEVAQKMQGHICRCCVYPRIVKAIQSAAKTMRGEQ
jgi:aerobic-type carbon monoxide dehydrogenase small subunit (CoxS/CutS family)